MKPLFCQFQLNKELNAENYGVWYFPKNDLLRYVHITTHLERAWKLPRLSRRNSFSRTEAQKYFFLIYSIWSCKFYIAINAAGNRAEGKLMVQRKSNKLLSVAKYRKRIFIGARLCSLRFKQIDIISTRTSFSRTSLNCSSRLSFLHLLEILLIATLNLLSNECSILF